MEIYANKKAKSSKIIGHLKSYTLFNPDAGDQKSPVALPSILKL